MKNTHHAWSNHTFTRTLHDVVAFPYTPPSPVRPHVEDLLKEVEGRDGGRDAILKFAVDLSLARAAEFKRSIEMKEDDDTVMNVVDAPSTPDRIRLATVDLTADTPDTPVANRKRKADDPNNPNNLRRLEEVRVVSLSEVGTDVMLREIESRSNGQEAIVTRAMYLNPSLGRSPIVIPGPEVPQVSTQTLIDTLETRFGDGLSGLLPFIADEDIMNRAEYLKATSRVLFNDV